MQEGSINRKQIIEFLDKDLEFLAGTGAGEGLDFYDIKDVIVNCQCAGYVVLSFFFKMILKKILNLEKLVFFFHFFKLLL